MSVEYEQATPEQIEATYRWQLAEAYKVVLINAWPKVPTFHRYGGFKSWVIDENWRASRFATVCGIELNYQETGLADDGKLTHANHRVRHPAAELRPEHALLFARPCRKCFLVPE